MVVNVQGGGMKHALFGAHSTLIRASSVLGRIRVEAEHPSHQMDKAGRPDITGVYKFPVLLEDSFDSRQFQAHGVVREVRGPGGVARLDFYHLSIEKAQKRKSPPRSAGANTLIRGKCDIQIFNAQVGNHFIARDRFFDASYAIGMRQ